MGRPKRKVTVEDQIKTVIGQALSEGKNRLAKDLIDILEIQQKANVDAIIGKLGDDRQGV